MASFFSSLNEEEHDASCSSQKGKFPSTSTGKSTVYTRWKQSANWLLLKFSELCVSVLTKRGSFATWSLPWGTYLLE